MIIIGADYHPGFQQIAFVDTETGDCGEQRLQHREESAGDIIEDYEFRVQRLLFPTSKASCAVHRFVGN